MPISNSKKISQKGLAADPALVGFSPAFKYLWRVYHQGCLRKDIGWSISPPDLFALFIAPCYYCGAPPTNKTKVVGEPMTYNGIDRIDNDMPYCIENVVPCCKTCNSMKSKLGEGEFIAHVKMIVQHQFKHA